MPGKLLALVHRGVEHVVALNDLDALAPLGLSTSLLHENIFRATNEVGPIRTLLGDGSAVSRNSPPSTPS